MGQCTSSEIPASAPDEEKCVEIENSVSESMVSQTSGNKFRRSRRSSAASWVSNRLQKRQKNKDLSAAFNLLDHDAKSNLVNINLASEEELMTLQGINRQLAKKIVEYRNTIGGFRRVEDLALVSGIGASLLQCFINDVTVKKYPSYSSSRTQSFDSIPSCGSLKSQRSNQSNNIRSLKSSPIKRININCASIFDLMNIRGINQEMAANIVHYRTKRGGFRHVDEIIKVKGMNSRILSVLRVYITCNDDSSSSTTAGTGDSLSVTSCGRTVIPRVACHRRTQSAPLHTEETVNNAIISIELQANPIQSQHSHRFSSEFSADLFELLSLRSDRPLYRDIFDGSYHGYSALRVGSWNMQQLTLDKVSNPGVLEVICRTLLETGFSLIALQEISNTEVLNKICSELNYGSLRRIREWNGPKGEWKWHSSDEPSFISHVGVEYAAFIYNESHGVQLTDSCLLQVYSNNNSKSSCALFRKPFLGYFKIFELNIVIVNIHLQTKKNRRNRINEEEETDELMEAMNEATNKNEEVKNGIDTLYLSPLISALREKLDSEYFVVLLGNFNLPPEDTAFDVLSKSGYNNIIPTNVATDISYDKPKGSECLDNIWLSSHTQRLYTNSWGVVRDGLSHMAIPRGWGWGGMVSEHCPIYCDLYTAAPPISKKLSSQINKPFLNGK